ncbi:MAG: PKD domain-containing protein [Cytophagales bacterium]
MKKIFLGIILFFINFIHLQAQFVASDLSYTCLGSGKYTVKLELYTECGTDGSWVSGVQIPLYVKSAKLNVDIPDLFFDKPTVVNEIINLYCKVRGNNCYSKDSKNRGLRKYVYYKTIDLSTYSSTDDWDIIFLLDFQDKVFSHLVAPDTYPHVSSTNINTTLSSCNNSPVFRDPPILKSCLNKKDTLDLTTVDSDGDKLVYTLVSPITKINKQIVNVTYASGYSFEKPLNVSENLKIVNGGVVITGTKTDDVGAVDVLIDEYRNNVKIATTRRNLQLNILDCNNNAPTISDFVNVTSGNKKQIVVCSGDTLKQSKTLIKIAEKDTLDRLSDVRILVSDSRFQNYFQVVYGTDQKTAEVYVPNLVVFTTPVDLNIKVEIKATDSGCPTDLSFTKTFNILVKARPIFDFRYDEAFISCSPKTVLKPSNQKDLILNDTIKPKNLSGKAPFTYKWEVWHIDNNKHVRDSVAKYKTYKEDSLLVKFERGVTVTISDSNGCKTADSIYIKQRFKLDYSVSGRCLSNDSTVFTDLSYSEDTESPITKRTWYFGAKGLATYYDTKYKDSVVSSSVTDNVIKRKYCEVGRYPVRLVLETAKGCRDTADTYFSINNNPVPDFDLLTTCRNEFDIIGTSVFNYPTEYYRLDTLFKKKIKLLPDYSTPNFYKHFTGDWYVNTSVDYYVSKVFSGIYSKDTVKLKTKAVIQVLCDSIKVSYYDDSLTNNCFNVLDYSANRVEGMLASTLSTKTISKVLSVVVNGNTVTFKFKEFNFGANREDTIFTGNIITRSYLLSDLKSGKYQTDTVYDIQNQLTDKIVSCKEFVNEDDLKGDILISPYTAKGNSDIDYTFPNLNFVWENQGNRIQKDTGTYILKMKGISAASCPYEIEKEYTIRPEPTLELTDATGKVILSDTIFQNCIKPDTMLFATNMNKPNGDFVKYKWSYNPTDINTIDDIQLSTDSSKYPAANLGVYYVYAQDQYGCDDTSKVTILSGLKSDFYITPSCVNDSVTFVNLTTSGNGPKVLSNDWILINSLTKDTIETFSESASKFQKIVSSSADVNVILKVKDSLSCSKEISNLIYKSKFTDNFSVPSGTSSICATDKIYPTSILLQNPTNHIDSIVWNLGDGRKIIQTNVSSNSSINDFSISYPNDSTYKLSFKVYYNSQNKTITDQNGLTKTIQVQPSCVYASETLSVGVKPEFKGKLFAFRNCTSDTSEFIFEKDPSIGDNTINVQKIDWKVYSNSNIPEPDIQFPIVVKDSLTFKQLFTKARGLRFYFTAQDQNGCIFRDSTDASIDQYALPYIVSLDSACYGSKSTIRLKSTNKTLEGVPSIATKYGVDYYGNPITIKGYETSTGTETVKFKFPKAGENKIKAYMIMYRNEVKSIITDRIQECRGVVDTTIYVRPTPEINFTADPVCARNDTTRFVNLSKFRQKSVVKDPKDSTIVSYVWDFGDGTKSNVFAPKHVFKTGGIHLVSLTATTAAGCSSSDTLETKVKNSPAAFFSTVKDSTLLDFNEPIDFINKSVPLDQVGKALWEFGDGDISNEIYTTTHQYDNIDRFNVKLTVWNTENECPDVYRKIVELRPILLLPNAFSPNNDGTNDELFLIYRLIEELEEFKIFNRWGQVVFDANGDLKASWDGKFKGVDQELGVYVVHVKAKGKHGVNYNFKQNISLIR